MIPRQSEEEKSNEFSCRSSLSLGNNLFTVKELKTYESIGEIKIESGNLKDKDMSWEAVYRRIESYLDLKRYNIVSPGDQKKKAIFNTPCIETRKLDRNTLPSLASPLASSLMRKRKASAQACLLTTSAKK